MSTLMSVPAARPSRSITLLPALLALAAVTYALQFSIMQEQPTGNLAGKVTLSETGKPFSGAEIHLTYQGNSKNPAGERFIKSDTDGRFSISHLLAGTWTVSASSRAHEVQVENVDVDEKGRSDITLAMHRNQADLAVGRHLNVFSSSEKLILPVRGYIEPTAAPGKDQLKVTIYRSSLSTILSKPTSSQALESVGRYFDPAVKLPAVLLKQKDGSPLSTYQELSPSLREADREGFYYQRLELGMPGPGLYLIDLQHGEGMACAWLLVTDTAMVLKHSGGDALAWTVNMQTGAPLAGRTVRAWKDGKVLAQSITDSRGLAQLKTPVYHEESSIIYVAEYGSDEAVVGSNSYQYEEDGQYTLHTYTDRPIYRPGQTVLWKSILRRTLEPGQRYALPGAKQVSIEVRDPSGERIAQDTKTTGPGGSVFGKIELSPETRTGVYSIIETIQGEKHTHDFVVASYKKPEFSAEIKTDKPRYFPGDTVIATIHAEYYFGAAVGGARVSCDIYSSPDWYSEFDYGDDPDDSETSDLEANSSPDFRAYKEEYGEMISHQEIKLDNNGNGVVRIPVKVTASADGPQSINYNISATITEASGREVGVSSSVSIVPGEFRLNIRRDGYLAKPGTPFDITLVTREYDGKPRPNVTVDLETGYEKYITDPQHPNTGKMIYNRVNHQSVITDSTGRAIVHITPPRNGEMRLIARTKDPNGREIRSRSSIWVSDDSGADLDTEYGDLSLMADHRSYQPGSTARVLLNASRIGETALVTVEGLKIYKVLTVPILNRSTILQIPVLESYGPNVSLSACYVANKHFARSEINIRVSIHSRLLNVSVKADRESSKPGATLARYKPGDKITYRIHTADSAGRPVAAECSLGVVDESIYALMEDDPRAIERSYYPRRINRVNTEYSFAVEYLGDADKAEPKITARKRFPDTAFWQPVVNTDLAGNASVSFNLPDNLTTWRATVNAVNANTQVGFARSKVISAKEFFVRLETTRYLTERDETRLLAMVHNMTDKPQTALIRLRAPGLQINGQDTATLTVQPGSMAQTAFKVTAISPTPVRLLLTAWTPKITGQPQYTDGLEVTLPILAHAKEQVTAYAGTLIGAQPETETIRLSPNAIPSLSKLTVRISPSLFSTITGSLDYLIGYPYGCVEQTMSRFMPDLLVQKCLRMHQLKDPPHALELPKMIRDSLARLYRFQHTSGGWGWWEHDNDDVWMTAYVLYGMNIAQQEGYPVSKTVFARGRKSLLQQLNGKNVRVSPYCIYVMNRIGMRSEAIKLRSGLNTNKLALADLADIALLDAELGLPADSMILTDKFIVPEAGMIHWQKKGVQPWYDFRQSDEHVTAIILRAIIRRNPSDSRILPGLRWLISRRTGNYWRSTEETAAIIEAFCDYLNTHPENRNTGGKVTLRVNGQVAGVFTLTPSNRLEPELIWRIPASKLRSEKNDVQLIRESGSSPVFYSVELIQSVPTNEKEVLLPSQLTVKREYRRILPEHRDGEMWANLVTEPTNNLMNIGDNIRVTLNITVPEDLSYVMIEDPFPAGCEVTARGEADETDEWIYNYSSADIRDNKIVFFVRQIPKGKYVINYTLHAQTPGTFHTMPTLLQAMYASETRAESVESIVVVK